MFILQRGSIILNNTSRQQLKKLIYTILIFLLTFSSVRSQLFENERYVQVNGMIIDMSNRPVGGVAVVSKKFKKGILSEKTGIYSITSTPGDTIYFRALGFKRYHTIIPESFKERHCEVDIVLETDTIQINQVNIMPWKNYSEFIKDMTKPKPSNPIIDNMNENIASVYVAISNPRNVRISPEAGFEYAMEQNFNTMRTRGQTPYNNLLNPIAWTKFIKELKNGLLKNRTYHNPQPAQVIKKKVKKVKSK